MQRYMIRPLQHGLDLSHSSLNAPFPFAYWPSKNFRVSQHSAQKRWGYNSVDRELGAVEVQAIVLYQLKNGTRSTLYLTPTNLIKKEPASGKTWSYITETYTTGDIVSITGTAVVGTGANWDADVAKDDYFIMDFDHTADEEPHRVVTYDAGDDGDGDIPDVGDTVTSSGGATGTITAITIDSGTFAGADAVGDLILSDCSGTWTDDDDLIFEDEETAVINGASAGAWILIKTVTDDDNLILDSAYTVKSDATLNFDSGSREPSAGDVLEGATSGASGTVLVVTKSSNTWGGGDAVGSITLQTTSGLFNDNENVDNDEDSNVLTVKHPNGAVGVDKLVKNGAFVIDDDPPDDWTDLTATLTGEGSGKVGNCMKVASSGANVGKAYQDITTVVGKAYKFSGYFKKGDADTGRFFIGITTDEDSLYDSGALTDASWAEHTDTFTATAITTRITCQTDDETDGEYSLFDEITVYEMPYGLDYKIRKVYTTPTGERWTWCIIDDMFIFTNGNTFVQKWTGSGYASNLNASYAIKARYCIPYANRLFIADYGTARDPLGIAWSKEGDPEDWTDSTAGSGVLIETKDFIMGLGVVGASIVIYKSDSIAFGHRTGDAVAPISIPQTRERRGIGLVAPYSIIDFMGTNAFVGRNDFYIIEGDRPVAIGEKMRDKFFDIIDLDDIKEVYGWENNITNELCWTANTSEGRLIFAWDYKLREWSVYDFEADFIMAGKGAIST